MNIIKTDKTQVTDYDLCIIEKAKSLLSASEVDLIATIIYVPNKIVNFKLKI